MFGVLNNMTVMLTAHWCGGQEPVAAVLSTHYPLVLLTDQSPNSHGSNHHDYNNTTELRSW